MYNFGFCSKQNHFDKLDVEAVLCVERDIFLSTRYFRFEKKKKKTILSILAIEPD